MLQCQDGWNDVIKQILVTVIVVVGGKWIWQRAVCRSRAGYRRLLYRRYDMVQQKRVQCLVVSGSRFGLHRVTREVCMG